MIVERLTRERAAEAVAVLCDSFRAYPTMRYIVDAAGPDYDGRLRALIEFFVMARCWRDEPVLAVTTDDTAVAVAIVTLPGERTVPAALTERREALWRELGAAARKRYEAFGAACEQFAVDRPHHHLNMIGVSRTHAGLGLGRRLLDAVHELSARDPDSCGVTLNTEDPANVPLYEHFGYEVLGQARVSGELETWVFFRPDSPGKNPPAGAAPASS